MILATAVLAALALILLIVAWRRGDGSARDGFRYGWETLKRTGPLLLVAFVIVGYINVLNPQALVQSSIGPNSGLRGLLLAEVLGTLMPGGPYVVFPLMAVIYQAGAGLGPTVTLITSWAALDLISVSFELPFMGWRFSAIRWGLGLAVPVLAGGVAQLLFGG